jgi:ABC-type amino acid transport substrate-binding protein
MLGSSMRCSSPRLARICAVAAFLIIQPAFAVATETNELGLASDVWPPFTNIAGHPRLAIDLVHEALERAGIKATTNIVDWSAVTPGLRDGSFDGSAAIWHTAQRESFLLFSNPYLENRLVLVGQKGSDVSAESLSHLIGKRVAVVESYAYGETVEKAAGPQLVEGLNNQGNLRRLLNGDVDYMLVDDLLIRHLLEYQQDEAIRFLQIGSTPLVRRTLHFAVRKDLPGAEAIIESFNAAISTMLADGTYNDILQLSWIRADVDGDGRLELVPRTDKIGAVAPVAGYHVVWPGQGKDPSATPDRFLIKGQLYESWAAVPDHYKVPSSDPVDGYPGSTSGLVGFKF